MANPLPEEEKIEEQIKKENIKVDPIVWELISHHIRNDLNSMSIILGSLQFIPAWILKVSSFVLKFLYKISFQRGTPPDLIVICDKSLNHVKTAGAFLKKLRAATCDGPAPE